MQLFGRDFFSPIPSQPYLVGGIPTPLKNDGVRQWGWDDIPYMKWKS